MTDARRDALHGKVDALGDHEVVVVDHFVDAVLTPVDYELTEDSWLTVQPWAEAFLARLRAHHALNPEPLSTTAFESAFNASCKAAGWRVLPSASATNRFFDTVLMVPGRGRMQISLKASAARDMREEWVHISKLTEAAWIQDTGLLSLCLQPPHPAQVPVIGHGEGWLAVSGSSGAQGVEMGDPISDGVFRVGMQVDNWLRATMMVFAWVGPMSYTMRRWRSR